MITFPIPGMTMGQLEDEVKPNKVAGDMNGTPQPLYDTQLFTQGATTFLTFFTTPAAGGLFLTNMSQGGQLPNPEFMIIQYITLDILGLEPGNFDRLRDTYRLLFGQGVLGGPYAVFHYSRQDYGPWPLSQAHATGGPTGFSTRNAIEYANNGHPGTGGIFIGGAIILPPLQAFSLDIRWSAPVALDGNVQLRAGLHGPYYRQIH